MSPRTRLAMFAALATALTSTALAAVYVDHAWLWPTIGAILAVLIGAEAGSRLGSHLLLPTMWRAIGAAAGLTMFACARYASAESYLGFVPTPSAVSRLRELSGQAFDDINSLAAPVPGHTGLVLVTTLGVGLIAIVVDLLSVRAALAGLPLLALYSVPEWLAPHGTGPLPFVLGAVGYLALLLREGRDRTTRWGRAVELPSGGPHPELVPDASPHGAIGQTGRRIGFAALGIALVLPPLMPTLDHPHLFGIGAGPGNGRGSGTYVTFNPITKIYGYLTRGENSEQLRYRSSNGQPTYLQWTTLDRYNDNSGWAQADQRSDGSATDHLPSPSVVQNGVQRTPFTLQVQIADRLDLKWLPVPADTTAVRDISSQWVYDAHSLTIWSPHQNTRGLRYGLTAVDANPSTQALLDSPLVPQAQAIESIQPYYDLPLNISQQVRNAAHQLTKDYSTPYQKALALQNYFARSGLFHYSTDAGADDSSDLLARFVLDQRHGFCEQFASAMAVMARMVGIPSRVAVGFIGGTPTGDGEFTVTSNDAHAWPELYFDGIGWLRFEPTPRADSGAAPPGYANTTPDKVATTTPKGTGGGGVTPPEQPGAAPRGGFPHNRLEPVTGGGTDFPLAGAHRSHGPSARTLALISLAGLLLLALLAVPLSRGLGRRRAHARASDSVARAHVAWRDVLVDAADLGMRVPASDSPRAVARRLTELGHLSPGATTAIGRLASAEERARYAPRLGELGDVERDARMVSRDLRAAAGRWVRLRAALLPPSTLRTASDAVSRRVQGALDRIDALAGRLVALARRAVRRPRVRGA